MISSLSSTKLVLQLTFLVFAFSICSDPSEPQGRCTQCVPNDILIDGKCYVKIRGCLKHSQGPVCLECQFGYVFFNSTCIREAVFKNNTDITKIPPVLVSPRQFLTIQQINKRLGDALSQKLTLCHQYFLSRYTNNLEKGNILDVNSLESKSGLFIIIFYEGKDKNKYEAVGLFDKFNVFKEWSFQAKTNISRNPWAADNLIRQAFSERLQNYLLFKVIQSGQFFILDYIKNSDVIRFNLSKNDLTDIKAVTAKAQLKNLIVSDLGIQKFYQSYPQYSNLKVTSVQKIEQFYVISLGLSKSVSFRFKNDQFLINEPLSFPQGSYVSSDIGFKYLVRTAFSQFPLKNYTSSQFVATKKYLENQYPEISGADVLKVQYQQISGSIAFLITLKKKVETQNNIYQFVTFFNESKLANLVEGRKNGKVIYQDFYNYNLDFTFFTAFQVIDVSNVPPIATVTFRLSDNIRYYKIIFSAIQFAQISFDTTTNNRNFVSYFLDGENILKTLEGQPAQKRTPQSLLYFIKTQQPTFYQALILEIYQYLADYFVTVVSDKGTHRIQIVQRKGQLQINQFVKINNATCFDMNFNAPYNVQKVAQIDSYLKQNYNPLKEFEISLMQVSIGQISFSYRFLYSNGKSKQITAYLQEKLGVLNLKSVSYINSGYQNVEQKLENPDYRTILTQISNSNLNGNKIPFFTEVNVSNIKAYYDDGKSIYEFIYDKTDRKSKFNILYTNNYLLVPQGFSLQNLIIPGTTLPNDIMLAKINQQMLKKYGMIIRDSRIAYADKKNNIYNIMLKGNLGYQKLQVTIEKNNSISIGRLILTNYKEGDFSNCQNYSPSGKCLSCNINTQIEYQGVCHKKIEGCLIQPGPLCVKCNDNYVKDSLKCIKECRNFFIV